MAITGCLSRLIELLLRQTHKEGLLPVIQTSSRQGVTTCGYEAVWGCLQVTIWHSLIHCVGLLVQAAASSP